MSQQRPDQQCCYYLNDELKDFSWYPNPDSIAIDNDIYQEEKV